MDSEFNLSGKKALVTGGSRGIGLAAAKAIAKGGADVAIMARDKERLGAAKEQIQAGPCGGVWTFCIDLAETERIEAVFGEVVSQMGEVDILVNCAGITRRAPAEEVGSDTWDEVLKVNLTAVFVMSQVFCRHRKQISKPGRIINIGSLMCHQARPETAAYAASKGGLLMLTKSLAVEWAKYGINVNAVGPGYIATDLTASLQADEDFDRWVLSKTPAGRWGRPEDIAGAVVFLASAASDFITGQIIYVDGGWLAGL